MNTVARIWCQVGPRIYGLALILKVGIPLLFVLSLAISGYTVYSAISEQVTKFENDVQHQITQIQRNAKAIQKPVANFNRQFKKVMGSLKPVVNAVNKVGNIWPISKLRLNFLRLPSFPVLRPVIDRTKSLARSALALQNPLLEMSAQVRKTYEKVEKIATVVSTVFLLWVMALVVVFGARWALEFVQGWKLLVHGAVPEPVGGNANLHAQLDTLRSEIGKNKESGSADSRPQPWLVMLALILLLAYGWTSRDRLIALFHEQPVVQPVSVVEDEPPEPEPVEQRAIVELDGELLFNTGSAAVSAYGKEAIQRLVPELLITLGQAPDRGLVVGGHTDDIPVRHSPFASNRELSIERAKAVASLLVEAGLPTERVVAIGYGASQPRIPNDEAVSRHLNRRVEMLLVPTASLDEKAPDSRDPI